MAVSAPVKEPETATSQKPLTIIRARSVSASIFANPVESDGRDFIFHKVSVQRAYKQGNEWKYATTFGRDDLPLLKKVVDEAWDFILDAERSSGKEESED